MRAYLSAVTEVRRVSMPDGVIYRFGPWAHSKHPPRGAGRGKRWPLPNVWLGVSVEDQTRADERIPHLLNTPAAVRFISAEPLLGPVDLGRMGAATRLGKETALDCLTGDYLTGKSRLSDGAHRTPFLPRLDWVITGGESGPGARPMHPDWARGLRDQCAAAGVPFFFKQWGEWLGCDQFDFAVQINDDPGISRFDHREWEDDGWSEHFRPDWQYWESVCTSQVVCRVGKRAAGHTLDGETYHNWPATTPAGEASRKAERPPAPVRGTDAPDGAEDKQK